MDGDLLPDRCLLDRRDRVAGVMNEELIKRLREDDTDPVMLKKAADTIEAQAAEIDIAVKAREALIMEWLRKHGMRQTAMMLEKGEHLK
jgi:hypothetical protein